MHEPITAANIEMISDLFFKSNAQLYLDIEEEYREQVARFGLEFSDREDLTPFDSHIEGLVRRGLKIENDHKSLHTGWISPSCLTCRRGIGAATLQISNQCPRDCFFCFNHNQKDYDRLRTEIDDPSEKIREYHSTGIDFHDFALTGGEPLLHIPETIDFFSTVNKLFPHAYTRLYTCGAFFDEAIADRLAAIGLDEIRFSIKTDDSVSAIEHTLNLIAMAESKIPAVVVEMPVMPDELDLMKNLLIRLDEIGIKGINLLELGFPFCNAEEFSKRGYKLKSQLFRTLYDYKYAAGLPIAGSEEVCLRLLKFALDQGLTLGVHYCSLENKYTSQIYLQNVAYAAEFPFCEFSERDYFLKSVKAFGNDADSIKRYLLECGLTDFAEDEEDRSIEFPPSYMRDLKKMFLNVQMGLSYHVVEHAENEIVLRELRLDLVTPSSFVLDEDV